MIALKRYDVRMANNPYRPPVIFENGKPKAVIVAIDEYEAMLEQIEQIEDLRAIREMTAEDWKCTTFDEYLRTKDSRVPD